MNKGKKCTSLYEVQYTLLHFKVETTCNEPVLLRISHLFPSLLPEKVILCTDDGNVVVDRLLIVIFLVFEVARYYTAS